MLDTKQRNKKIFHILESTIHDFCKVLGCSYFIKEKAIMVQHDNEDVFYIYPEFNERDYDINIVCMIFQNLTISKTAKLKEVYNSDEIAEFVNEAGASLWFLDDTRLVMSCAIKAEYSSYAILKVNIILECYINVQNARKLKEKLEVLLAEREYVIMN